MNSKWAKIYRESLKIIPRSKPKLVVPGIIKTWRLVVEFFEGNEEKAELWFKTQNPLLGGISPEKMIVLGRRDRLLRFVRDQLAENKV